MMRTFRMKLKKSKMNKIIVRIWLKRIIVSEILHWARYLINELLTYLLHFYPVCQVHLPHWISWLRFRIWLFFRQCYITHWNASYTNIYLKHIHSSLKSSYYWYIATYYIISWDKDHLWVVKSNINTITITALYSGIHWW